MQSRSQLKNDEVRKRIRERSAILRYPVKHLSIDLGLHEQFISDFVNGRKESLPNEIWEPMAKKLKTKVSYLLLGIADDDVDQVQDDFVKDEALSIGPDDVEGVSAKEKISVILNRVDMETGFATVNADGIRTPRYHARIVDPDFLVPGNAYALAFAQRQSIRVLIKRVKLRAGIEVWFILDTI